MYKIVVGNISAKWQADWFCGDDNPYGIYQGDYLKTPPDGWRFQLHCIKKYGIRELIFFKEFYHV